MKKSDKIALLGLTVIIGITGSLTYQKNSNEGRLSLCNNGEIESCKKIENLNYWKGKITNKEWKKNETLRGNNRRVEGCLNDNSSIQATDCAYVDLSLISEEKKTKIKEKYDLFFDSDGLRKDWTIRNAKQIRDRENDPVYQAKKRRKAEEEQLKAEGWWEPKSGIFVRWCENSNYEYPAKGDCPRTDTYLDSVWRMMVWCKEKACGDIYAKVNLDRNGVVMGWTNDTAYGGYGQKVVLTFQSSSGGSTAQLIKFSTY